MRRTLTTLVALAAAVVLAACASPQPEPTPAPAASASPSVTPSASPSTAPSPTEEPWQTVTAEDGATWQMPADWTTVDASVENSVGRILQLDVLDADGATMLSYVHDLGGLGGIGGACETFPAVESFATEPSDAGFAASGDETFLDSAYAIAQPDGSVSLTIGVVPDTVLDASRPACLVYNIGQHPVDGRLVSFATGFQSGVDAGTDPDGPWNHASFDEARAFVDSDRGQELLEVVTSLRLQP